MLKTYASQLRFNVKPSRIFQRIVFVCTVVALVAIFLLDYNFIPGNLLFMLLLILLQIIYAISTWKNNRHYELCWLSDGSWLINQGVSAQQSMSEPPAEHLAQKLAEKSPEKLPEELLKAELCSGSVVTTFFALLNFKLQNRQRLQVLLFSDNVDAEVFRRFRVRVKVEGIELKSRDTILP